MLAFTLIGLLLAALMPRQPARNAPPAERSPAGL
jgi:hypothetical protein